MEKTLGLDLGTNSIGWAVVAKDKEITLTEKGVHIFQEGVKVEKGTESSKAAERTDYRALRRHYFRRKLRKIETLKALSEMELCPPLTAEQLKEWQNHGKYPLTDEFILWQRTNENSSANPYYYRYIAVNRKLNMNDRGDRYMLGRALYHMAQRRGFLSNRLDSTEESDGKVKGSISDLNKEITVSGCRTLGEYFYECYGNKKIRGRYTSREEHYKAEFDAICDMQEISPENRNKLEKAIFYQRPLRSQKGLVGKCTFEKDKPRCPVSHPRYEHYRMMCFINNIKIKTPFDNGMRQLDSDERAAIIPLFRRKSKETFDFEDIAKKLAGKGNYSYYKDSGYGTYAFNYKMNTTVTGSPVTSVLVDIFGEEWEEELMKRYTAANGKTEKQVVNDVWHALYSFDDREKLKGFGIDKLGLDEKNAKNFADIKIRRDYPSLSLNAIDKILLFLEQGMIYTYAVFLANMGSVLPPHVWENESKRNSIIAGVISEIENYEPKSGKTLKETILDFLRDNFELRPCAEKKLYHPSMVETYPQVTEKTDGCWRLGTPRTSAIRNPMAMRTLFQLRELINRLLAEGKIDKDTKINIEMSRQLNNANMRKAIEQYGREREKEHNSYRDAIRETAGFGGFEPSRDDLLKYRLWIEQDKKCIYTGNTIGISDFLGKNPLYDIEHTIPRSIGGDNSQMNKTLTESKYNREIKKNKIPSQLADHEKILAAIEPWKKRIDELETAIQKSKKQISNTKEERDWKITKRNKLILELNYWRGKYQRFTVPYEKLEQGFRNSQGVDAGIISKYARLYLCSLFPKVYTVKGEITAEFRKLWGLQEEYEKKERANHVHHCVDAVVLACIGKAQYDEISKYYEQEENNRWYGRTERPHLEKPWPTFTEDVKSIEKEILVSHYTADNLGKHTKKKMRVRGRVVTGKNGEPLYVQGDTARGALHEETYYGAIMREGEIKYVVRKELGKLKNEKDVENIVDDTVREKVLLAVRELGFKEAISSTIWMNEEKRIPIKKVRCYTPTVTNPLPIRHHRDESRFEYKRRYHVKSGTNYMMAIYEGKDAKGQTKRGYELINNLDAARAFKKSGDRQTAKGPIPSEKNGLPYKYSLKTGTMVIFWENSPEEIWDLDVKELRKRMYKVTILTHNGDIGKIELRHHQEARPKNELNGTGGKYISTDEYRPRINISHNQLDVLVEGYDFEINILGEIKRLK